MFAYCERLKQDALNEKKREVQEINGFVLFIFNAHFFSCELF